MGIRLLKHKYLNVFVVLEISLFVTTVLYVSCAPVNQDGTNKKRDRIPVNTVCYLGPAAVFNTNDDVTLYNVNVINGDSFSANNMLSGQFHFWLRDKTSVKVLYHGPYQGYVAPDAPQSTRKALAQFEICQIQILDGAHKSKIGWVVDTDMRCPTQKGR